MKKRKADDNFIKQPYYEGGDKAMKEFIGTHLRYPDLSRNANTEGEVHLKYEIDYKGIVTDVKLIGGLDQYCNDEAIRVIRMLRFIVPKITKHLKVTFHKNITVHFRIHAGTPDLSVEEVHTKNDNNSAALKVSYSIIQSPGPEVKNKEVTYFYTINQEQWKQS